MKIICVEGKDVLLNGSVSNKYSAAYDYSLDMIKLAEVYEKVYRKSMELPGNKTDAVCMVKFSYAYREWNKRGKNVFVRAGHEHSTLYFKDNLAFSDNGILIGCQVGHKTESKNTDLFRWDSENNCYTEPVENKVLYNVKELRDKLYREGFELNGKHYVRDKRSSGSGRVGKCMFIDEKLYKSMWKWEKCGIDVYEGMPIDLAGFEAYISLVTSSIINTIELRPENFLVVDDYDSVFDDDVVSVELDNGRLSAQKKTVQISNSIFDGQSLIDLGDEDMYSGRSMLLLRNRFFKSACFKCRIQKYFSDNGITDVKQLKGFTVATDIRDIKIITTPSSIKYLKFGTIQDWFKNIDTMFGIVKYEKPTHFIDGMCVQAHYQLINTLRLTEDEVRELAAPSLDYIEKIRNDPDVLKYHIKLGDYDEDYEDSQEILSRSAVVMKLIQRNKNFTRTKMYRDFVETLVKAAKTNFKRGHILIEGNYSTLIGNGCAMLQRAIGTFDGTDVLGKGEVYTKRFPFGAELLICRSPHICGGNVMVAKNKYCPEIEKYFSFSKEILYVNAIGDNIQQRLNGCDYDSDSVLITDNSVLIAAAKRDRFEVPTNNVQAKKIKRYYTTDDKCDLDIKTGSNKIGEIVNLSQWLNSMYWDSGADVYLDICKLAVMSNIEIDKAKREYDVDMVRELADIKANCGKEKPMFFKMITTENGYKLNPNQDYRRFNTPMDWLQKAINGKRLAKPAPPDMKFSDIVVSGENDTKSCRRVKNIVRCAEKAYNKKCRLYADYENKSKDEKKETWLAVNELKVDLKKEVVLKSESDMRLLLKKIEDIPKGVGNMLLDIIFSDSNNLKYLVNDPDRSRLALVGDDEKADLALLGCHGFCKK